jgi:predicted DNA-binding transcriptional regulator AlpA
MEPKKVKEIMPGPSVRCLDVKRVAAVFCTSRSEILRRVAAGTLPRPFKLGRKLLWRESTIVKAQDKLGAV